MSLDAGAGTFRREPADMRVLMINSERGWRGGENQVALLVAGLGGGIETLTACQPGGELDILRQPYAKGANGYNVSSLAGLNTFPTAFLAGMAAADSFDFTGVNATSGPPVAPPGISPPVTEIHYVRANQGNGGGRGPTGSPLFSQTPRFKT